MLRNQTLAPPFQRPPSRVVIRRVASYQDEIASVMFESLAPFGLQVQGKSVLLKPNLVGLDPQGFINTHPTVIAAARECFLRMGASQVLVGDGPALDRDTEAILESVRLREHLGPLRNVFGLATWGARFYFYQSTIISNKIAFYSEYERKDNSHPTII